MSEEDILDELVVLSTFEKKGKKYPTISLHTSLNDQYGFTFGLTKAKLILKHIKAIEKFVEDNTSEDEEVL
jgi:hypothetical protein